jgi:hypothetical protein
MEALVRRLAFTSENVSLREAGQNDFVLTSELFGGRAYLFWVLATATAS